MASYTIIIYNYTCIVISSALNLCSIDNWDLSHLTFNRLPFCHFVQEESVSFQKLGHNHEYLLNIIETTPWPNHVLHV